MVSTSAPALEGKPESMCLANGRVRNFDDQMDRSSSPCGACNITILQGSEATTNVCNTG